jgi:CheY-like chemotaxis protein
MEYHDPVRTAIRPRLVILKGSVPLDPSQVQSLKSAFDVVEVHSPQAARKMLDGSIGGVVICAPGEYLTIEGEPLPTAASSILERVGEGIGVVDSNGALLWTDARFKVHDEHVRNEFVRLCKQAIELFNAKPTVQQESDEAAASARRQSKRFGFASGQQQYELIVSPASLDQSQDRGPHSRSLANGEPRVTAVVGVLWEVTASRRLQEKLDAIDAAGADLMRIEAATLSKMNMAERLKMLEQKIIRALRDVLKFDNFEIRLLDRQTGQLELVIAVNISPLKIGEVMYASTEDNGISGYVAATGKSYICPDVQHDPLYREGLDNAASSLTVPLMLHDRVIGTLNVESSKPNAFDENDRRFAEIFGRYIAAALNILDLLVIERFTTNEQTAANVVAELARPLADLDNQATALRDANVGNEAVRASADQIIQSIAKLRSALTASASGPRTILGAEQELHRQEPDPLLVGKRILVADDEPAIRDTLSSILTQKGALVTVCSNGEQTIQTLETSAGTQGGGRPGETFDLVISDIKMPDRNGYEVYRTAKSINPNTPVILMTGFGYDPHHCIVRASQEGLQSFLFKPFKASQLMDVIGKSLAAATAAR